MAIRVWKRKVLFSYSLVINSKHTDTFSGCLKETRSLCVVGGGISKKFVCVCVCVSKKK